RDPDPQRVASTAVPAGGRRGRRRDATAQVPVPRPAPTPHAARVPEPRPRLPRGPRLPARPGIPGGGDAVSHPLHPRGRARLPGPEPAAARQLLRAAPVPPAFQAAADGGGFRALLPDRALLPGRGPAP